MMFGANLLETILGGVAAVAVSFLAGAVYDHNYGPNAWKLAAIKTQLAKTNSELSKLQREDAQIASREREAEDRAESEFAAIAPHLKKCVLDKAQVEALNKQGG